MIRSLARLLCWCVAGAALVGDSAAQETATNEPPANPLPALPANRAEILVNNSIVRQHEAGAWSVLGVSASNSTESDQEGLIAVFNPVEPSRQFTRRLWVPSHARRYSFVPFHVPADLPPDTKRIELSGMTLDPQASGRETLQHREGQELIPGFLIGLSQDALKSAMFTRRADPPDPNTPITLDQDAWDTLITARKVAEQSDQANDVPGDFLPPWSESLEQFEQFLLTTDRIAHDAAGLVALRAWVRGGGRLWLTLDRMSPDTVRLILGNAWNFEVVDQVELDQYTLESLDVHGEMTQRDECEYEVPVELVRVTTSSTDVPCRINGWPAAIWVPMGEGEVLVTMLAPRGWRPKEDRTPSQALRALAHRLFSGRQGQIDRKQFQSSLQQQIGYRIPGRPFGTAVLGIYCGVLAIGGVFFYRQRQAERFVWLVPIATVLAAGILVIGGAVNSQSVPPTIASIQLVTASPESDELTLRGLAAIYDQQNRPIEWQAGERALAVPEASDGAEVRRQLFGANDESATQNVSTRAGSVSLVTLDEVRTLTHHMAARARLGPKGLEGHLVGGHEALSDSVIVSPATPPLGLRIATDGTWLSTPDDVLPVGQYTADSLLSDEQRRRQDALRQLLDPADNVFFPRRTSLIAWREPFESSVRPPEGFQTRGEALVVLPLEIDRTPPDTEFQVPASLIRITAALGGPGKSLAYNARSGQWVQKLTSPSDADLNFHIPPEVLPCRLARGKLSARLNAPSREFTVWTFRDGKRQLLRTVADPNGVYDFDLDAEQLTLDEQGRIRLGITVGPTAAQRDAADPAKIGSRPSTSFTNSTWQIEYLRLTVEGRTAQGTSQP